MNHRCNADLLPAKVDEMIEDILYPNYKMVIFFGRYRLQVKIIVELHLEEARNF